MGYNSTANYGLRTPERSNKPLVSGDMKQLAEDVDKALGTVGASGASAGQGAVAAQARADAAFSMATQGKNTADTAQSKADIAQNKADTAKSAADTAQARADAAYALGTQAKNNAATAINKGDTAQQRADAAFTLATTAKSTADTAQARADEAYTLASSINADTLKGVGKNILPPLDPQRSMQGVPTSWVGNDGPGGTVSITVPLSEKMYGTYISSMTAGDYLVPIEPGTDYRVSVKVKSDGSATKKAYLYVRFVTDNGQWSFASPATAEIVPTSEWQKISSVFSYPQKGIEYTKMLIGFYVDPGNSSPTIFSEPEIRAVKNVNDLVEDSQTATDVAQQRADAAFTLATQGKNTADTAQARADEAYTLASSIPLDTGWINLDFVPAAQEVLDTSKIEAKRNNLIQIRRVGERVYMRGWCQLRAAPQNYQLAIIPVGYRAVAPESSVFYSYRGSLAVYGNTNVYSKPGEVVYTPYNNYTYALFADQENSLWRYGTGFTMTWIADDKHPLQK